MATINKREIYAKANFLAGMLETAGHACITRTNAGFFPFVTIGDKARNISELAKIFGGTSRTDSRYPDSVDLTFARQDAEFLVEAIKVKAPSLEIVHQGYKRLRVIKNINDQAAIHNELLKRFDGLRTEQYPPLINDRLFLAGVFAARGIFSFGESLGGDESTTIRPVIQLGPRNVALMETVANRFSVTLRIIPPGDETNFYGRKIVSTHPRGSITINNPDDISQITICLINYAPCRTQEMKEFKERNNL